LAVVFHKLIDIDEALGKLSEAIGGFKPLGIEEVELIESDGRILAENIVANVDAPPFDRSEVDGYAVNYRDIIGANEDTPVKLKIIGKIEVGRKPNIEVKTGKTVEIATGAPIPRGANSVVMIEYTKAEKGTVLVYQSTLPGEKIGQAGSDVMIGDTVLTKGVTLTPREVAVLAAIGHSKIKVYQRPNVSILSTGDEIVSPGSFLPAGSIYDVNGITIRSLVEEVGASANYLGIVRDNYSKLRSKLSAALDTSDMVITSGSTSAGIGDIIYKVFNELGEPGLLVHGLKIKPGKPTVAGVVNGRIIIGLPGFPLSAMIAFHVFVKPILRSLLGLRQSKKENAVLSRFAYRFPAGKGKRQFVPVNIVSSSRGLVAYPITSGSGAASTLTRADGFVEVPENREFIDDNEEVEVRLLSSKLRLAELNIIGSHCQGVNLVIEKSEKLDAKIVNVGSKGGWTAALNGEADIAGTHLLDEDTMEYNIPFLRKFNAENKIALVRGYVRNIGFILPKGNPKKIASFKDLFRDDVVFINRNIGSGTRTFIDHNLSKIEDTDNRGFKIRGYENEAKTHSAVAAAVAQKRADVGFGVECWASHYNLKFTHIAEEEYDFIIPKERIKKPAIQEFLTTLSLDLFKNDLKKRLKGYSTKPDTGKIIFYPK